jgi:hypothetical protein
MKMIIYSLLIKIDHNFLFVFLTTKPIEHDRKKTE